MAAARIHTTEIREDADGPSVLFSDALRAPLVELQRNREAAQRLQTLLKAYRGAETPDAWREIYAELGTHYDLWLRGDARGNLGLQELALVPLAEHDAAVNPGSKLRRAVNYERHADHLRTLYHDPAFLERISRGKKVALSHLFGQILPAIECDSRAPPPAATLLDKHRLDMYMISAHLLWWTAAAAEALHRAEEARAEEDGEAPLHADVEAVLRGGTEVMRVQAQTLFVTMCLPFCTDPLQRRRTGETSVDIWLIVSKDASYTEQINHCLRSCRGLEWLSEEQMELEKDEAAFDANLEIRMPSEVEAVSSMDPLSEVIRRRTLAQRTLKASTEREKTPPSEAMRAWCEDAWLFMAWANVVDGQLNVASSDMYALFTFQQCLVKPHVLGSAAARNKYTGQPYGGVARLPTITIVSGGLYVFRCTRCGAARRFTRARGALAAWFNCVSACYNGRDGFGTRIQ